MVVRLLQLLYSGIIDAGVTTQTSLTSCMHPSFNLNHKFNQLPANSTDQNMVIAHADGFDGFAQSALNLFQETTLNYGKNSGRKSLI